MTPIQAQTLLRKAMIYRHPGHGSQKVHGNRFGASGEKLEPGKYKKQDVVKGNKGKGGGSTSVGKSYDFLQDDKGLKKHYNLNENCKKQKVACEGISDYTKDDASVINSHLRGKSFDKIAEVQETVQKLDKAFEVMPRVPEDTKVARFIKGDVANMMQPGTVFKDNGYVSTTINPELAFESYDGEADWKVHINVPKGAKALYISEKSEYPWEKEMLFPRGTQMRITGRDPNTQTITAEYVQ